MDAMTLETYVKAGKRLRYKGLTPKRNENIEIFITSQKNFKGIKVGIIDSQNRIRYIQDRGRDLVEHRFKIEKEGKYDVFIEQLIKSVNTVTIIFIYFIIVFSSYSSISLIIINIRLQIAPKTKSVKVGYLDADKVKHYKTVKAEINHNFIIQKTGYIEVFVENSSGKTVTASGTYTK